MTSVKIVDLCEAFALNVKNEIDRVQPEIKKPEAETSGLNKLGEPDTEPRRSEYAPILAGSPKSYNTLGENMTTPFRKIPEWLHNDVRFIDAEHFQQSTFQRFLHLVVSKPTEYNIKGNIIILQPGQYCCSRRELARQCGKKFTEENIRGTIRYFTKVEFLTQTLTHGKTLITLCDRIVNDMFFSEPHPNTHPQVTQRSPIKQDYSLNSHIRSDSIGGCRGNESYEQSPKPQKKSPLSHSGKKKIKNPEEVKSCMELVGVWGLAITQRTMEIWHTKYDAVYIASHLRLLTEMEKPANTERWMESALKNNYVLERENVVKNRQYATEYKTQKKWEKLELLKKYCRWNEGKELYYHVASEEFKRTLDSAYAMQIREAHTPQKY